MSLTVDVDTERIYRLAEPDQHAAWWAWLAEVVGENPRELEITAVTLGEGFVDVERLEVPIRVVGGDEVARFTQRYPAATPPPCWPG